MNANYEVISQQGHTQTPVEGAAYESLSATRRRRMKSNMRVTLNLPVTLLDRLRNTVYWTPGLTLTSLIAGALKESLDHMERQQGRPFPSRLAELKSGRPRKRPVSSLRDETARSTRFTRSAQRTTGTGPVSVSIQQS